VKGNDMNQKWIDKGRFASLFFRLLWRQWEPKSCGIPDQYRMRYRIPFSTAWQIAKNLWW